MQHDHQVPDGVVAVLVRSAKDLSRACTLESSAEITELSERSLGSDNAWDVQHQLLECRAHARADFYTGKPLLFLLSEGWGGGTVWMLLSGLF